MGAGRNLRQKGINRAHTPPVLARVLTSGLTPIKSMRPLASRSLLAAFLTASPAPPVTDVHGSRDTKIRHPHRQAQRRYTCHQPHRRRLANIQTTNTEGPPSPPPRAGGSRSSLLRPKSQPITKETTPPANRAQQMIDTGGPTISPPPRTPTIVFATTAAEIEAAHNKEKAPL